jgi:hypothetical protein
MQAAKNEIRKMTDEMTALNMAPLPAPIGNKVGTKAWPLNPKYFNKISKNEPY